MIVVYCSDLLIAYSWAYLQLLKPWLKTQGGLSTCSPLHSCTVSPRGSSTGTGFTAGTHCQHQGLGWERHQWLPGHSSCFPCSEAGPQGHSRHLLFCRVFWPAHTKPPRPLPTCSAAVLLPKTSTGDFFIFQRLIFSSPAIQEKPGAAPAHPQRCWVLTAVSPSVLPGGSPGTCPDGDPVGAVGRESPTEGLGCGLGTPQFIPGLFPTVHSLGWLGKTTLWAK